MRLENDVPAADAVTDKWTMSNLGSPSAAAGIIKKYNFDIKKKFGQNFLIDANILEKIVNAAQIEATDTVLEIGPGIGSMTQLLCERAERVIAVEIDKTLIPVLTETLSGYDNVTVINGDIMKVELDEISGMAGDGALKVVANLPYYITTPIIMRLLEEMDRLRSITIMVQSEVADRMKAGPSDKNYGALSLAVQYYADPRVVATVPPECFMPRPKVDSSVIRLECLEKPPVDVADEGHMFKLIRASFNQRRKTLANGLKNAAFLPYSREEIVEALDKLGLTPTVRGEELTLEQFAQISNLLNKAVL